MPLRSPPPRSTARPPSPRVRREPSPPPPRSPAPRPLLCLTTLAKPPIPVPPSSIASLRALNSRSPPPIFRVRPRTPRAASPTPAATRPRRLPQSYPPRSHPSHRLHRDNPSSHRTARVHSRCARFPSPPPRRASRRNLHRSPAAALSRSPGSSPPPRRHLTAHPRARFPRRCLTRRVSLPVARCTYRSAHRSGHRRAGRARSAQRRASTTPRARLYARGTLRASCDRCRGRARARRGPSRVVLSVVWRAEQRTWRQLEFQR